MKKSELKKYVRENIISELSENTEDEIAKTKELTTAIKDLESAKKEAGIEEGAIDPAEYGDIGVAYLKGFNKPHSLDLDQLEKLGREIVKRLYKGDFEKAKAKFLKEDEDVVKYKGEDHVITRRDGDKIYLRRKEDAVVLGKMPEFWVKSQDINENEDAEPTKSDIREMGYNAGEDAFEKIKGRFRNRIDHLEYRKGFFQGFTDGASSYGLNENEDAEPTKSDIKKN